MSEKAFLKGKNITLAFSLAQENGQAKPFVINCTSFSFKPNVTEIADPILGRERDDLDSEVNFYEIQMEVQVRDAKLLSAFLIHQKQKDLKVSMADSAVGLLVRPHDGTQQSFQARGFVLGAWEFGIAGRTDRLKVPVPGRCQYIDPLPGA